MASRQIPSVLWVALIFLGIATVGKAIVATQMGPWLLLDAALCVVLLIGLYLGHRWAYVVTVIVVPAKLIVVIVLGSAGAGLVTFLVDCVVLVPVLASTRYFWWRACPDVMCGHKNRTDARYCARCGTDLTAASRRLETPL